EFTADRVDVCERTPECGVVAASSHLQILEHQEGLVAAFAAAQRRRDARTGAGERRQTVGLGREIVELRTLVDFREVPAAAALEHEAAVDAAAASGRCPLDLKLTRRLREGGLQGGEKPGGDQVRFSVARARLIEART